MNGKLSQTNPNYLILFHIIVYFKCAQCWHYNDMNIALYSLVPNPVTSCIFNESLSTTSVKSLKQLQSTIAKENYIHAVKYLNLIYKMFLQLLVIIIKQIQREFISIHTHSTLLRQTFQCIHLIVRDSHILLAHFSWLRIVNFAFWSVGPSNLPDGSERSC